MSADQTQAQMNPGIARLNAFFANMRVRFFDLDLVQVAALCGHRFLRAGANLFSVK
jgi:hypothetical protein